MLRRQKTLLALLDGVQKPMSPTVFVKLSFLLREETEVHDDATFYACPATGFKRKFFRRFCVGVEAPVFDPVPASQPIGTISVG